MVTPATASLSRRAPRMIGAAVGACSPSGHGTGEEGAVERRKWEMCMVSTDPADAYVEYWDQAGPDRKSLAVGNGGEATELRVRRVLSQLGDAGWELSGVAGDRLYFKRQKA
jgi:hypothetical protein